MNHLSLVIVKNIWLFPLNRIKLHDEIIFCFTVNKSIYSFQNNYSWKVNILVKIFISKSSCSWMRCICPPVQYVEHYIVLFKPSYLLHQSNDCLHSCSMGNNSCYSVAITRHILCKYLIIQYFVYNINRISIDRTYGVSGEINDVSVTYDFGDKTTYLPNVKLRFHVSQILSKKSYSRNVTPNLITSRSLIVNHIHLTWTEKKTLTNTKINRKYDNNKILIQYVYLLKSIKETSHGQFQLYFCTVKLLVQWSYTEINNVFITVFINNITCAPALRFAELWFYSVRG